MPKLALGHRIAPAGMSRGLSSLPMATLWCSVRSAPVHTPSRLIILTVLGCVVTLWMHLKVISEANRRDNWRAAHARSKAQRNRVSYEFLAARRLLALVHKPYIIKLTRIGPGDPLDSDNLQRAFKACRDEVAKCLGVDDGDTESIRFRYSQTVGAQFMVRIRIGCLPLISTRPNKEMKA